MAETEIEIAKAKDRQPSGLSKWTPSLPTNVINMLNPFGNDGGDRPTEETNPSSTKRLSFLASLLPTNNAPSSGTPDDPPSPIKDDALMFAEPDSRSNSDGSQAGSIAKSKKSTKAKTRYSMCHPPPASTTRHRLHRRPRSLLQLHKLSPSARPRPAFEVIPSANFSVRLTKTITKVFRAKHGLCPNDLVVLRAENYSTDEPNEEQEARDIIALICKGRRDESGGTGKARICFPDGGEWEAYPTPLGGYEFFSTDEHGLGLTVRWVLKKNKDGCKPGPDAETKTFGFSTISPNSRRHPVIANLDNTRLDINDTYRVPEPSAATPLSTPKQRATFLEDTMDEELASGNDEYETDDRLRQIIIITGIWVMFKEGWSPYFKYDDRDTTLQRSPSKASTFSPLTTPPSSPGPASPGVEKRNSMASVGSNILRKGSLLGRSNNRKSTVSVPEEVYAGQPAEATRKTGRTRADSASTVLVHRAASNRVKNQQSAWRPSSVVDMQERPSVEDREQASDVEVSPSRASRTRQPVAQPILPSPSSETVEGPTARPAKRTSPEPQKRESSTTTTTDTSVASGPTKQVTQPVNAKKLKKKRSGWRRLLCGGGNDG